MPTRRPPPSILHCLERRCAYTPRTRRSALSQPKDVAAFLTTSLYPSSGLDKEVFSVLCLDARNVVRRVEVVSVGTLSASLVHPREVFRPAIRAGAASIIVCHNHPSGDPTPSGDDVALTRRLVQVGELVGIEVLDHLILGHGNRRPYHSMKAAGDGFSGGGP